MELAWDQCARDVIGTVGTSNIGILNVYRLEKLRLFHLPQMTFVGLIPWYLVYKINNSNPICSIKTQILTTRSTTSLTRGQAQTATLYLLKFAGRRFRHRSIETDLRPFEVTSAKTFRRAWILSLKWPYIQRVYKAVFSEYVVLSIISQVLCSIRGMWSYVVNVDARIASHNSYLPNGGRPDQYRLYVN
jgi:hypothetical protein